MINSDACHDTLKKKTVPDLSFNNPADYNLWKNAVKDKFHELLGIENIRKNSCPSTLNIERDEIKDGYRLIRFVFESEIDATVSCYLLIPDTGKKKYPVAIVLQGHSTGFHNSIGQPKYEKDFDYMPRGAFALQAVKNGFAALAIEQRGMGERKPVRENRTGGVMCDYTALTALMLGRTVLGERIWDVSRAIDMLVNFPECDTAKILITGNSGGGTTSYYSACFDKRIKLCVPSCSFCSYENSVLDIFHCACNYIPSAYNYFEMGDLACMIAPRNIVVIAGDADEIFPISGVNSAYKILKRIYASSGFTDNCRLVVTPKGHCWCEDIVWREIANETEKLGWR